MTAEAGAQPIDQPDRTLCGAKTRAGGTCTKRAGEGTGHPGEGRCKHHAGSTPSHELKGAVILARREAQVMGVPLHDVDPHEAILECIRIAAGEVQYASSQIWALEDHEAVGPLTTVKRRPLKGEYGAESPGVTVEEVTTEHPALHIWIAVRHQAMDRLVHYSKVAIAAGIAERQVQLAERYGEMIADVLRGALSDLGHDVDAPEVQTVVRKHLTVHAGGRAGGSAA